MLVYVSGERFNPSCCMQAGGMHACILEKNALELFCRGRRYWSGKLLMNIVSSLAVSLRVVETAVEKNVGPARGEGRS